MDNRTISNKLKDHARRLASEQANLYRVQAYRRAAETIERLALPLSELVAEKGAAGLRQLPGIGDHLAFAIERLVTTGEFHALADEAGEVPPAEDVRSLPGVGPHLAQSLWEKRRIRTVEQLETALRENQLEGLIGAKRRQQLWTALEERGKEKQAVTSPPGEPTVAELLHVDEEYRQQAEANRLPTIAPHRFNPANDAWLPLYSTRRGGWKYRALYSNTALAHRLGRTRDWVVIYFSNDAQRGQRTVVTESRGDLRGRRVVRGRERECQHYYQQENRGAGEQETARKCYKKSG